MAKTQEQELINHGVHGVLTLQDFVDVVCMLMNKNELVIKIKNLTDENEMLKRKIKRLTNLNEGKE